METQRLETVSQPHHSCPPVPPHLRLSSFLPSSSPFLPPLLLPTSLLPAHPCTPSHRCCRHHHHLSLPQLKCPVAPAQHHPCNPQGTRARVPKVGERHRNNAAGSQSLRRAIQTKESLPDPHPSQVQPTLLPHLYDYAREMRGRSGGFPFQNHPKNV